MLKVVNRKDFDEEPVAGHTQHHLQKMPLIALVMNVLPLDKSMQETYFDDEAERRQFRNENESRFGDRQVTRLNYKNQYMSNFHGYYYTENRSINPELKNTYDSKIDD